MGHNNLAQRFAFRLSVALIALLLVAPVGLSAQGQNDKYPTEFNRTPKQWIPLFFMSSQFRGQDHMKGMDIVETLGLGAGFLYNVPMDESWMGHKFFYYYLDAEFQQEYNTGDLEEEMKPLGILSPGIMIRSFVPFMKIYYGAGLTFRFGDTDFEPWGVYGQAGIEIYGVFLGAKIMGAPGQGHVYNELRIGYMLTP